MLHPKFAPSGPSSPFLSTQRHGRVLLDLAPNFADRESTDHGWRMEFFVDALLMPLLELSEMDCAWTSSLSRNR